MNEISSTLKEEIKKSKDSKKKEQLKFITAILATNIAVALLCLPTDDSLMKKESSSKILHPSYQMMVIPIKAMVSPSEEKEVPITIISKDKKVIAEKAYLHEEVKNDQGVTKFKIEISNSDLARRHTYAEEDMVAVPYIETINKKKSQSRGSKYEISI